jgi:phage recombination protein Bet
MENTQLAKPETFDSKVLGEYLDAMGLTQMLTPKEKTQFIEISKAFGLNPFKREIYCVKYKADSPLSIIVGYESYIKRAERSGQLDGWNVVTEGNAEDSSLKAIITIYRKDRKYPFVHEVFYSEYVQKTNDGRANKFWQKSQTMTKKVAIAQGFRLCFSDELGGMPYTSEEINDTEYELVPNEPKAEPSKNLAPTPTVPTIALITEVQHNELLEIKKNPYLNKKEMDWIDKNLEAGLEKNIAEFIIKITPMLIDRENAELNKKS